jgi:hypothetical protein
MERATTAEKKWIYIALAVWSVIILATLYRGVVLWSHPRQVGVYPLYAQAGWDWIHGHSLYSSTPGLFVYRYSPLTAALMAPLALLPGNIGSGVVRLLSVSAFLGGLWWWSYSVVPVRLDRQQRAILFLLASPIAFQALGDVQMTGLIVGLMLLGTAAAADSFLSLGILFLVLATMVKAYPIALLVLLALIEPRRMTLRSAIVLVAVLALPFALQRPTYVWTQYTQWLTDGLNMRTASPGSHQLVDVRELLGSLHITLTNHQYLLLELAAAGLIAILVVIARLRQTDRRTLIMLTFGLATCWMTLLGPATESQTLIIIAPIAAWLLLAVLLAAAPAGYRWMIALSYALFSLTQIILWFPFHAKLRPLALSSVAGILLMSVLTALMLRQIRPLRPAPLLLHHSGDHRHIVG